MIKNKVYYIHARQTLPNGDVNHLGGVTIAWKVDDEGNVIVGQAARCRTNERFVKTDGASRALELLNTADPLFVMPNHGLRVMAASEGIVCLSFKTLTPLSRAELIEHFCKQAYDAVDLSDVMGSNWYEEKVRERLHFNTKANDVSYDNSADDDAMATYLRSVDTVQETAFGGNQRLKFKSDAEPVATFASAV